MGWKQIALIDKMVQMAKDGYRIEFAYSDYQDALIITAHKEVFHSEYDIDMHELELFADTEHAIMNILSSLERHIREMQERIAE